jgi:hypothetical protein
MSRRTLARLEIIGAVAWPSFLAAAAATMVFFAMFDPVRLGQVVTLPFELGRGEGYTAGFFLFWLLTALSSYLTALLLLTRSSSPGSGDGGG